MILPPWGNDFAPKEASQMQLEICQAPLSSHLKTKIFLLACAAYPGALKMLHSAIGTTQSGLRVCLGGAPGWGCV